VAKGKFWELNKLLFANQETLEDENLKAVCQAGRTRRRGHAEAGLRRKSTRRWRRTAAKDGRRRGEHAHDLRRRAPERPALRAWYLTFTVDDELQWQKEKAGRSPPHPRARQEQ